MGNYLEVLSEWMEQPHYLLLILILLYFLSATIDFIVGSLNASLDPKVLFSTTILQLGIVRKLVILSIMILVVPLALILPMDFGIYSLTILYIGIVVSEIHSILANIGMAKDGGKDGDLGRLISDFLEMILKNKGRKD